MPLPAPKPNQSKKDFMKTCMANQTMNNEFPEQGQRYAVCNSLWEKRKKGGITTTIKHKTYSADMFVPECDRTNGIKVKSENGEIYTAVAVIGNQFWNKGKNGLGGKPEFSMANALKRDHKSMDNTFHNINHSREIQDIVGININTEFEDKGNRMIIHIKPDKNMSAYGTWYSFLKLCHEAMKTPNVSIEAYVECEDMKASDLPEGTDYQQYGIEDDDIIEVEIGYRFIGTATVIRGACSDSDGCGIDLNNASYPCTDMDDEDKEVKNMTKKKQEEPEKPEPEAKPEETEEEETEEETEDKPKEEKEKDSDLVLTLKEKLVTCGENRKTIEAEIETLRSERDALEEQILALEKDNEDKQAAIDNLNEKLSKPVTKKQTVTTKDEDWKVNALKQIMRRE